MNPILVNMPISIETPRLILRPPQSGDGPELNAAITESFEELIQWMPWAAKLPTQEESEANVRQAYAKWILRENLRMSIFDKATGKMAGSSGFHNLHWDIPSFEIGYWVRTEFAGKGYIKESTNALTRFAFDFLKAKRVEIRCDAKNGRSKSIMKSLGFELEGCLRNSDTDHRTNEPSDTLVYSRLNAVGLPELTYTLKGI